MIITSLSLQNFRTYHNASFSFSPQTTVVIGPNASGKTNLLEAIYLLARGVSFRAGSDSDMITFGEHFARVDGTILPFNNTETHLEVILFRTIRTPKRYRINAVPRRRVDFVGQFQSILFLPSDLDIVSGSPSVRRDFLDEVLETTDREYRIALLAYQRALKHRNALLHLVKERGKRSDEQFAYWNEILIKNGEIITKKREEFITYCNARELPAIACRIVYDKSIISEERLLKYKEAEVAAGVTLVGPHRDDFSILFQNSTHHNLSVKTFGSRGQQRLVVLQLRLLELSWVLEKTGNKPILLLDDIFSELDDEHIRLILNIIDKHQTILTTTHEEFVKDHLKTIRVIELGKKSM